jgi:hypothetical protein
VIKLEVTGTVRIAVEAVDLGNDGKALIQVIGPQRSNKLHRPGDSYGCCHAEAKQDGGDNENSTSLSAASPDLVTASLQATYPSTP